MDLSFCFLKVFDRNGRLMESYRSLASGQDCKSDDLETKNRENRFVERKDFGRVR